MGVTNYILTGMILQPWRQVKFSTDSDQTQQWHTHTQVIIIKRCLSVLCLEGLVFNQGLDMSGYLPQKNTWHFWGTVGP